jgi:hypothetical protein
MQFLEAPYPNGVGLPESELRKILKHKHKHEDKSSEKAAEMERMRKEVMDELNPELAKPVPPPEPGPGRGHKKQKADSNTTSFTDRGAPYALRRLKRDRPDLAEGLTPR